MIHKVPCNLYIASCDTDGGIYQYALENGKAAYNGKIQLDRPMYFVIESNKMYVLLREPFLDSEQSGLVVLDIMPGGRLKQASEIIPTNGVCACHLAVDDGDIYVANYFSGSIGKIGGKTVQHVGRGPNKTRQDAAHAHAVILSPDKKQVLSTDLGLDRIFVYDRALNEQYSVGVSDGYGVRHILFDKSGKYLFAVNELVSSVSLFSFNAGMLAYLDTFLSRNAHTKGNTAAAIRQAADGTIYISNRGGDTIESFSFKNSTLTYKNTIPCGGKSPRDFIIHEAHGFFAVTNQDSDSVTIIYGKQLTKQYIKIKSPLCIAPSAIE